LGSRSRPTRAEASPTSKSTATRRTGYEPRAAFPSLEKNDGARAADSSVAFLGKRVTRERKARIVNRDRFDDGVRLALKPCKTSTALITVNKADLDAPPGNSAYLNLLFDWNQNGKWAGKQRRCGAKRVGEWVVKNYEIDLTEQTTQVATYEVPFRAGHVQGAMWYRAILSVDEKWKNPRGAGAFASGEVEDYRFGNARRIYCPDTIIDHDEVGFLVIRGVKTSELRDIARLVKPTKGDINPGGTRASNAKRRITQHTRRSFEYDPRHEHAQADPDHDTVWISVRLKNGRKFLVSCEVAVLHDHPTLGGTESDFELEISHKLITGTAVPQAQLCIETDAGTAQAGQPIEVTIGFPGGGQLPPISSTAGTSGRAIVKTNLPVDAGGTAYNVIVRVGGITKEPSYTIPG
jgi:hypothetical protein